MKLLYPLIFLLLSCSTEPEDKQDSPEEEFLMNCCVMISIDEEGNTYANTEGGYTITQELCESASAMYNTVLFFSNLNCSEYCENENHEICDVDD